MPLLPYANRLEPVDDAAIWRYLDLPKFRDLIASEEGSIPDLYVKGLDKTP